MLKRTDSPRGRFYELEDGRKFPSVTSILSCYPKSEAFLKWLAKQGSMESADAQKQEGGNRGSAVHKIAERILRGEAVPDNPEWAPAVASQVKAFRRWEELYKPHILWTEKMLVEPEFGYAGTADFLARIGGRLFLCDIKTSKGIWETFPLQLEAYERALRWEGTRVETLAILRLPQREDDTFEFREFEISDERFEVFLACLTLWKYVNRDLLQSA